MLSHRSNSDPTPTQLLNPPARPRPFADFLHDSFGITACFNQAIKAIDAVSPGNPSGVFELSTAELTPEPRKAAAEPTSVEMGEPLKVSHLALASAFAPAAASTPVTPVSGSRHRAAIRIKDHQCHHSND